MVRGRQGLEVKYNTCGGGPGTRRPEVVGAPEAGQIYTGCQSFPSLVLLPLGVLG